MTVANIVLPDTLPFSMRKGQIRLYCTNPDGKPIGYHALPRFLGEELCQVIDYKSKHIFYGDELLAIFQRLFPKKYGKLEENEWYVRKVE